jgi:excisionase family DNA binding protein
MHDLPEISDWLTVEQVARMFQCSKFSVYRAIRAGRLEAQRLSRKTIRIRRDSAARWGNS